MAPRLTFDHCLLLRAGVIAEGGRCLSILRMMDAIKPSRLRMKLLGLMPTSKSVACNKFAGEMGVQICDSIGELLAMPSLDLVLEMSGRPDLLAEVAAAKPASVGMLDRQSSMMFFDIAHQYEWVAERESEISLASSFASAMLEASPDAVLVIDRRYRIINCNNSPMVTHGEPRESMLGRHCFEVIHGSLNPCSGSQRLCPVNEALRTKRPARAAQEVVNEKGEVRVRQATIYPLFNRLGEIVQFVEVIRDITQDLTVRIEQRAQAIKDDLARIVQEDRLASLGRLVASVCHEINNPISSIVTFNKLILSYIRENKLPPEGLAAFDRYLDLSVREALRCGDIVKNLLTFARQKSIEPGYIDMVDMINTIFVLADHQFEMAGVTHKVKMPTFPFTAWGDHTLIQQCLMNLIFNAMESMPGGGQITISGGPDEDSGKIWLAVSDTGNGIAPEDLPQIFEPFFSTKKAGKGVGLGLSMVYGIVRKHCGTIEVRSEPGQGTEFKLTLPAVPVSLDDERGAYGTCDEHPGGG